jgi:hypothetical protein
MHADWCQIANALSEPYSDIVGVAPEKSDYGKLQALPASKLPITPFFAVMGLACF